MNAKYFLFVALTTLLFQVNWAQEKKDSLVLQFHLKFRTTSLIANQEYVSNKKDTLKISTFKFYISNLQIDYADKSIYQMKDFYHLIDLESTTSQRIPIVNNKNKEIKKITFAIGIDSLSSVSGAMAGDLDPTKGMYWAWQSGYINMKMEGKSSSCKTRKNEFHFHLGGYSKPNNALRKIEITYSESLVKNFKDKIILNVDIAKLFDFIDLKTINSIMIPGKEAMKMVDLSTKIFSLE